MASMKKVHLRIRRADSYTFPHLVHDIQEKHPELIAELAQFQEMIRDMCGGTDGSKMNAALLMPMFKGAFSDKKSSPLDIFPSEMQSTINRLLRVEVKNESQVTSEFELYIPSTYSVTDIENLLNSQIEKNEMVSIFDYVQTISIGSNHTGALYDVSVYYAVNYRQNPQEGDLERIKALIQSNCRNVINSLNKIALLPF